MEYFISHISNSQVNSLLCTINDIKKALYSREYNLVEQLIQAELDGFRDVIHYAKMIGDEKMANSAYICKSYMLIFVNLSKYYLLLDQEKYYESWSVLQDCIDSLKFVSKYDGDVYELSELRRMLGFYELLYPFKIFSSSEFIYSKSECSICGNPMNSMKCQHRKGELYWGEVACEIITKIDKVLAVCAVEKPDDKRCVLLPQGTFDEKERYKALIDYLNLHIQRMAVVNAIPKHIRNRVFSNIGRNEHCPCGSGKKYKNCCESGYINYEIIGIEKITPVYFSF